MAKLKPVLGRGLASLIPRPLPAPPVASVRQDDGTGNNVVAQIDVNRIHMNPYQPRAEFDPVALDELKRSIVEKGIIQPVTVRRVDGGYQLISGERRVRASREAGLAVIPAYIIQVSSNEEMLELALIENLQREHLNPIEIAISYKRLIDECHYTQEEMSRRIGKDRTTITNALRLLKLPDVIQVAVRKGNLSSGHARALVSVDDRSLQVGIFNKIMARGLSVRDVEKLVRDAGKSRPKGPHRGSSSVSRADSSVASVEEKLRQTLGTRVQVRTLSDGKGEIVIEYYSSDDLERLLELLSGSGD